jgi:hypothetical protein
MLVLGLLSTTAKAFDHRHQAWTTLLKRHVAWRPDARVAGSYGGMKRDQAAPKAYLEVLSG